MIWLSWDSALDVLLLHWVSLPLCVSGAALLRSLPVLPCLFVAHLTTQRQLTTLPDPRLEVQETTYPISGSGGGFLSANVPSLACFVRTS